MHTLLSLTRVICRQEWIRFGIRARLARFVMPLCAEQGNCFTTDFFGMRYTGDRSSFIDWNVYAFGCYAKEELQFICTVLRNSARPVVVDVGANVGHHTLFCAALGSQVIAFEPYAPVRARLLRAVEENGIHTSVVVCPFALGATNTHLPFTPPSQGNLGTGSFCEDGGPEDRLTLEVKRGDDVLKTLALSTLAFVKIDTEGFEVEVLTGLSHTLAAHRPIVLCEWTQNERVSSATPRADLFPPNYRFFLLKPPAPILLAFQGKHYQLAPQSDQWHDGNLVAIPEENVEGVVVRADT